ncbi:MAG: hypothetical protein ACHQAX_04320, partial [Gammaproteobacteria bacterium]
MMIAALALLVRAHVFIAKFDRPSEPHSPAPVYTASPSTSFSFTNFFKSFFAPMFSNTEEVKANSPKKESEVERRARVLQNKLKNQSIDQKKAELLEKRADIKPIIRATNVADEDLQFYMEGVGMPAPADEKQVDETSLQDVEDKIEELDYAS